MLLGLFGRFLFPAYVGERAGSTVEPRSNVYPNSRHLKLYQASAKVLQLQRQFAEYLVHGTKLAVR